ncbi:MAG: TraB/GumN family protein [Eggerthia catenaformis]|uniref:TraB/GumN family protein n=1 Tax=Eggerthia catenaformis TaxID=31973 RepID=UPI003FA13184
MKIINRLRKMVIFSAVLSLMIGCGQNKKNYKLSDLNYLNHFYLAENNKNEKIYILGTLHLTKKDVNEFPGEILKGFNSSKEIYIETKIDLEATKKYQNKLYENSIYTLIDNKYILKYWKEIKENYKTIEEKYNVFNAIAIQSLASKEVITELGLKAENTMDMYIFNKAKKDKKKIIEVEGIEKQYSIISDISKKCPSIVLKQIADKKRYLEQTKNIWEDFCHGKEMKDSISEFVKDETEESLLKEIKAYNDILLNKRNNKMNEILLKSKVKSKFIAVGAAHIYGSNGIINYLREKGYKISNYK